MSGRPAYPTVMLMRILVIVLVMLAGVLSVWLLSGWGRGGCVWAAGAVASGSETYAQHVVLIIFLVWS